MYVATYVCTYICFTPHLFLSIRVLCALMCSYLYSSIILLARSSPNSGVQSTHRSNIATCLRSTNLIKGILSSLAILFKQFNYADTKLHGLINTMAYMMTVKCMLLALIGSDHAYEHWKIT